MELTSARIRELTSDSESSSSDDEEENSRKRLLKIVEEDEDDEEHTMKVVVVAAAVLLLTASRARFSPFYRRWQSDYLVKLAVHENSFVAEYRLNAASFSLLHEMLEPELSVNDEMACRVIGRTGSAPISTASRLGAALIVLGGGRTMEAMRTRGISKTFAGENLHRVVSATNINTCPALAGNIERLRKLAGPITYNAGKLTFKKDDSNPYNLSLIHISEPTRPY